MHFQLGEPLLCRCECQGTTAILSALAAPCPRNSQIQYGTPLPDTCLSMSLYLHPSSMFFADCPQAEQGECLPMTTQEGILGRPLPAEHVISKDALPGMSLENLRKC